MPSVSDRVKLTNDERTYRNLHPHAEARLAMVLWGHEYAFEQNGGSMDFWDSRTSAQQTLCVDIMDGILSAIEETGRAARTRKQRNE